MKEKDDTRKALEAQAGKIARAGSSLPAFYEACLRQGLTTAQGERLILRAKARLKTGRRVNRKG